MGNRLSPDVANYSLRWWLGQMNPAWVLGPAQAERFAQHIAVKRYAPGEVIMPAGTHARCMGLVVQGEVEVLAGDQEPHAPSKVLLPGHSFGGMMLLEGQPCYAMHRARTSCEIWFAHHRDVVALTQAQSSTRVAILSQDRGDGGVKSVPRRWATLAGALALIVLVVFAGLFLPAGRRAFSVVPMSLAQWCSQQGHEPCAEETWKMAAALAPANADPLLGLGILLANQGELAAAEQAFEAALGLADGQSEVYNNLGVVYSSRGEYGRATAAFQRALELDPGSAVAEYNLGGSLQGQGAHEEALAHYRSALALGGPAPEILANMALAYLETGDEENARAVAQEALGAGEPSAPVYTVLGAMGLQLGAPDEAVHVLLQAVALDGRYAPAGLYLGHAYQALGQVDEARRALEAALSVADDQELRDQILLYMDELSRGTGQVTSP